MTGFHPSTARVKFGAERGRANVTRLRECSLHMRLWHLSTTSLARAHVGGPAWSNLERADTLAHSVESQPGSTIVPPRSSVILAQLSHRTFGDGTSLAMMQFRSVKCRPASQVHHVAQITCQPTQQRQLSAKVAAVFAVLAGAGSSEPPKSRRYIASR